MCMCNVRVYVCVYTYGCTCVHAQKHKTRVVHVTGTHWSTGSGQNKTYWSKGSGQNVIVAHSGPRVVPLRDLCVNVYVYVCMCECMYVCMYVCVYVCIFLSVSSSVMYQSTRT